VPKLDRRRYWEASLSPYFGRLHSDPAVSSALIAHCDIYDIGGIAAIRMEVPRSCVTRLARDAVDRGGDYFKLSMQLSGHADVTVDNQTVRLGAGDWIVLDQRRPYTWETPTDCALFGLQIPRTRLTGMKLPAMLTSRGSESGMDGMTGVMTGYLQTLESQIARVADKAAIHLADTSIGLFAAVLEDGRRGPHQADDSLAMLRLRASNFVRAHACDPELTVNDIAEALNCSRRYLYKAFTAETLSPEKLIWNARLERSREALLDPKNSGRPVASIAFDNGFSSDAHFVRAFKTRYGLPPAQYRQRSCTDALAASG
jgi:AraC-like DNA-binding protein